MTLGFLFGSKNFCKLLCVSSEVSVLHGYDWIHWVAKSCTTIAYRWLCRDSHPSLRTLWSAVIKSPKFPLWARLDQCVGALVIFVLKQISQCRSFGKWVKILCLPDTTFAHGSESNSWEELEASRCSGTLTETRFSVNSSSHSGRSRNGSPRTSSLSFLFGVFGFCWSTRRVSSYFITHILTSYSCGMLCRSYGFLRWRCKRCRWRWAWRACRWTRDNEWYAVRRVTFYLSVVVSDHWSNGNFSRDLRRVFRVKELPVYLREALWSRRNPILWHTLSLLLSFALRRWLQQPSSGFFIRLLLFPAGHMHTCSGVHHKLFFLRSYCGWQTPLIGRWKECSFCPFLWAYWCYWQVSTRLRRRIALVFQSPLPEICPQIS